MPGQIADVSIYKNAAYLASWAEPSCKRGGFFSVDITDPENPEQLAFVPALPGTYHGEGTHTITLNTPAFQGDVLAVNNEPCDAADGVGGFDLYDVSDPADPKPLVQGFGDRSPDHAPDEPKAPTTQDPTQMPNSAHSIFIWQDGQEAFAVIVDNTEFSDVDIFDITDPENPEFITDLDLFELALEQGVDVGRRSGRSQRQQRLPARHGRQADQRPADHARVLLGRRLHQGQRLRPREPGHHRRLGVRRGGPGDEHPGHRRRAGRRPRATATRASSATTTSSCWPRTRTSTSSGCSVEVDKGAGGVFRFFAPARATEGPQLTTARSITGDTRFVGDGCTPADHPAGDRGRCRSP